MYFCFTHVAIDHEGRIGSVYRTRSGMSEQTTACGALAAFTKEIASGHLNLHLDEDDLEQSMLKKHVCRKTALSQDPANPPDLLAVTMAAYETITLDLERHVMLDAALHPHRQYALFSGVQVHGPDGADSAWLGKSSIVLGAKLQPLPFTRHTAGQQLLLVPPPPPTQAASH